MSKLDALWAYQEAELKRAQVEAAIRSTPNRLKFNKLHKLLKTQQAGISTLSEEMETRNAQYERVKEQIHKLEERLELENDELFNLRSDDESTAEEMTELRVDIERLTRELQHAARDVKTLMTEIERASEEYQKARLTAGKAKKEYDQLRAVCEKEREESQCELDACTEELARISKSIEPQLLAKYEKVKQHHTAPVAKVINNKCSGCNMSLPMVMLKKLAMPDAVVDCENCGRILFSD